MLLDFNLAQQVNSEHARTTATLGGTVAYMSPEHLRALVARDPALASKVDERSDLYSLGMVLYEVLTGGPVRSERQLYRDARDDRGDGGGGARQPPTLRQRRDIPWSLESIAQSVSTPILVPVISEPSTWRTTWCASWKTAR